MVDVKTEQIESAELIAARIRKALETFPPGKLVINPDCGLRHLPADVARAKLDAMVEGTIAVRGTLPDQFGPDQFGPDQPDQSGRTEAGLVPELAPEPTTEQGA